MISPSAHHHQLASHVTDVAAMDAEPMDVPCEPPVRPAITLDSGTLPPGSPPPPDEDARALADGAADAPEPTAARVGAAEANGCSPSVPPAPPLLLDGISLRDAAGAFVPLSALADEPHIFVHGCVAHASAAEAPAEGAADSANAPPVGARVVSAALVRWYCAYAEAGPAHLILQSAEHAYAVAALAEAASPEFAETWRDSVRAVELTSRVLRAVHADADDVWSVARRGFADAELLEAWPFVREQLRALGVRHVRRPGQSPPPSPARARRAAADGRADTDADGSPPPSLGSRKRRLDDAAPMECELREGEALEVQTTRCCTPRYAALQRCRSCRQNRNEQCRFRFMRHLASRDGEPVRALGTFEHGSGYRLSTAPAGRAEPPTAADAAHAERVIRHLAAPLEAIAAEELELTRGEAVVVVNAKARGAPPKTSFLPQGYSRDGGERQLCDWCFSTIGNRYRTCARCGFEV